MEQNSDYKEHELIDELDEDLDKIDINNDYLSRRKFTSRSTFQEQPLIWGGIGVVFLLALIALLLGNGGGPNNTELGLVTERLEKIEQRITILESTPQDEESLQPQLEILKKSFSELNRSVNSQRTRTDNLARKMTRVEKELGTAKSTIKSQTTKSGKPKPVVNISKHLVKSGDTLYSISKKYSTTVDELRRLNNLTKDQDLFPGQELAVP